MSNPDGTSDKNVINIDPAESGTPARPTTKTFDVIDASVGFTAGLKCTNLCHDFSLGAIKILGGSENCVDINNETESIMVSAAAFVAQGKYALSAKTSNRTTFLGHIFGRGSQWEVNLGSWSDQSKKPQTNTHLCLTAEQYPIRVWVGNADIPTCDDRSKYHIFGFGTYGKLVRWVVMQLWGLGKKLGLKI